MSDTGQLEIKDKLLDYLQVAVWEQLNWDLRYAANGYWSIALERDVAHLLHIIRVRGVTPAAKIQIPLLKGGVYAAVCSLAGVETVIDFDLDQYHEFWGRWYVMDRTCEEIAKVTINEEDLD